MVLSNALPEEARYSGSMSQYLLLPPPTGKSTEAHCVERSAERCVHPPCVEFSVELDVLIPILNVR